jgi:hypothetical protein
VREELEAQKARVESQAQEHAKVLAARQELTAGLARANEAAAEHQRVRDEAQSVLDAERAVVAGLRQQIEREAAQAERIEEERRKAVAKHEELAAELAQIRELAAASDRALAELQATLDAERASHAASREASKRDRAEVTSADRDKTKALQDMSADLTRAREDAAASDRLRAETQSTLDAQRASNTELHQELERAQAVAASLEIEKAEAERLHRDVAAELSLAREAARLADLAAAEPLSAVASPPDVEPRGKAAVSAPLVPPLPPGAIDSSWQGVRSANRFSFREPLVVQINGEPGLLFDLSIAGCQVQSTSRLKPNHGIRVILPRDAKAFTCHGKVVWARLELPAAGRPLGYRAGVQFTKPDEAAIEAFLARHFT